MIALLSKVLTESRRPARTRASSSDGASRAATCGPVTPRARRRSASCSCCSAQARLHRTFHQNLTVNPKPKPHPYSYPYPKAATTAAIAMHLNGLQAPDVAYVQMLV